MYLIVIAWLYVALMMAVAEATNTTGTVIGAVLTFVLYGALPVSLVVYLIGTPGTKKGHQGPRSSRVGAARGCCITGARCRQRSGR